jgi:tRNA A37 N6-isopentenylltransferase MiaA
MLYYRALVSGLDALPTADRATRDAIDSEAAGRGWPALHAQLAEVDPKAAQRIPPNDAQRIQRALEVWRVTGKPMSSQQTASVAPLPFALKAFAIMPADRVALHRRIAERFDAMSRPAHFQAGAQAPPPWRNAEYARRRLPPVGLSENEHDRVVMRERLSPRHVSWPSGR